MRPMISAKAESSKHPGLKLLWVQSILGKQTFLYEEKNKKG